MKSRLPAQASKICAGCRVEKLAAEFYKNDAGRLRSRCAECYALHNQAQRALHIERRSEYEKSRGPGWARSGRGKYEMQEPAKWAAYIFRTYGMTAEQFAERLKAQGGVCAICQQECNRSSSARLCIDHCHVTGVVRGLLCFQCNVGLGKFRDEPAVLRAAANYLEIGK